MQDLVIIGAGPGGISASIYARRAGLNFLLLEKFSLGGQILLTPHIENYPGVGKVSNQELLDGFKKHLDEFGITFLMDEAISVSFSEGNFLVKTNASQYASKGVILSTGSQPRSLNVEGEKEFRGKGISYCAVCDGYFFKDKTVAVIGGGNTAVEEALYLSHIARKVYIVHRRNSFRAFKGLVEELHHTPNIEQVLEYVPLRFAGSQMLEKLVVRNVNTNQEKILEVQGVFISIGRAPQLPQIDDSLLEKDQQGFVITDQSMMTKTPGLFACGDVRSQSVRQIVVACAQGAQAVSGFLSYFRAYP